MTAAATGRTLERVAGGMVVSVLSSDHEGAGVLLSELDTCQTTQVALTLAAWYAALLKMTCEIGGIYADDPVDVMREFLLEVAG